MSIGFHPLKILEVRRETDEAISVTLDPTPALAGEFAFTPGQHLTFRATINGEDVRRNYSICVAPGGKLKVGIKRLSGGAFSSWAFETLKPGGTLETMPPRGHFTWTFGPDNEHSYLFFAGGSGITPILSLIEAGLATEPNSRFTVLFGNRTSGSIMFLEDLARQKDRYLDRLQVYHFLTAEADDIELFNGRLDAARIADVLSSLIDPKSIDAVFICGPSAMMDTAEHAMIDAGISPEQIFVERFAADRPSATDEQAELAAAEHAAGMKIRVTIDGRRRDIEFQPEAGSILESARLSGLPAPFACKAGVCATCRAKLLAGEVRMRANYGLSPEEVAQGYVLTCQAIPLGEGVALDYDA